MLCGDCALNKGLTRTVRLPRGQARDGRRIHPGAAWRLPAVAEAGRRVIDARLEGAESAIKWAHPTWSLGKKPVCYLKGASKHVTFGFRHGASIDDPSGRLQTTGSVMAHTKLRSHGDVDEGSSQAGSSRPASSSFPRTLSRANPLLRPRRQLERSLERRAIVQRLAVGRDHALERQVEQLAQRRPGSV